MRFDGNVEDFAQQVEQETPSADEIMHVQEQITDASVALVSGKRPAPVYLENVLRCKVLEIDPETYRCTVTASTVDGKINGVRYGRTAPKVDEEYPLYMPTTGIEPWIEVPEAVGNLWLYWSVNAGASVTLWRRPWPLPDEDVIVDDAEELATIDFSAAGIGESPRFAGVDGQGRCWVVATTYNRFAVGSSAREHRAIVPKAGKGTPSPVVLVSDDRSIRSVDAAGAGVVSVKINTANTTARFIADNLFGSHIASWVCGGSVPGGSYCDKRYLGPVIGSGIEQRSGPLCAVAGGKFTGVWGNYTPGERVVDGTQTSIVMDNFEVAAGKAGADTTQVPLIDWVASHQYHMQDGYLSRTGYGGANSSSENFTTEPAIIGPSENHWTESMVPQVPIEEYALGSVIVSGCYNAGISYMSYISASTPALIAPITHRFPLWPWRYPSASNVSVLYGNGYYNGDLGGGVEWWEDFGHRVYSDSDGVPKARCSYVSLADPEHMGGTWLPITLVPWHGSTAVPDVRDWLNEASYYLTISNASGAENIVNTSGFAVACWGTWARDTSDPSKDVSIATWVPSHSLEDTHSDVTGLIWPTWPNFVTRRSVNGGGSWQPFPPAGEFTLYRLLASDKDGMNLLADGYVAGTGPTDVLWQSTDGGDSWTIVAPGARPGNIYGYIVETNE